MSRVGTRRKTRKDGPLPVAGRCSTCHAEVLWLVNERTRIKCPINRLPEPGGDCEVDIPARTYVAYPPHIARGLDPTVVDLDAMPTLHRRHPETCTRPRARNITSPASRWNPV